MTTTTNDLPSLPSRSTGWKKTLATYQERVDSGGFEAVLSRSGTYLLLTPSAPPAALRSLDEVAEYTHDHPETRLCFGTLAALSMRDARRLHERAMSLDPAAHVKLTR